MDKFLKKYLNQWGLRGVKGIGGPGLQKSFFILANVVGHHYIFKNGLICLSTQIIYNLKVKQRNISHDTAAKVSDCGNLTVLSRGIK